MITVVPEPAEMKPYTAECCCFCHRHTKHWTTLADRLPGEQVACCCDCARRANAEDVPTKKVWIRRERIADGVPS